MLRDGEGELAEDDVCLAGLHVVAQDQRQRLLVQVAAGGAGVIAEDLDPHRRVRRADDRAFLEVLARAAPARTLGDDEAERFISPSRQGAISGSRSEAAAPGWDSVSRPG